MAKIDDTCIYRDNKFGKPLLGFSVDSVQCVRKTRMIGSPIETGQVSFDNKVIDPYDLIVKGTIVITNDNSGSVIESLQKMIDNRKYEFYSVADGATGYSDLALVKFPNLRDVEKYDWLQVELVFTHVMLVQKDSLLSESSNAENSSFRSLGYSGGNAS